MKTSLATHEPEEPDMYAQYRARYREIMSKVSSVMRKSGQITNRR